MTSGETIQKTGTALSKSRHKKLCDNVSFWESLLSHLARYRFNAITLWSEHPWPFMIRPTIFPNAELAVWKALEGVAHCHLKMARDRGIEPLMVDWNVFVSEGYKRAYEPPAHADEDGPNGVATVSQMAIRYNRECITQT